MEKITSKKLWKAGLILGAIYLCITYLHEIGAFIGTLLGVLSPLITGCIIAFVLNLLMKRLESWYFPHSQNQFVIKSRRPVCIFLSMLTWALILALICTLVIPELVSSFALIGKEIPPTLEWLYHFVSDNLDGIPSLQQMLLNLNLNWSVLVQKLISYISLGVGDVINTALAVITGVFGLLTNLLIGIIFALYLLLDKERLLRQFSRLFEAHLKPKKYQQFLRLMRTANESFSSFIVGQFTEAIILGLLCTAGMFLLRLPYAAMTGAVVGATALIPIVGAYIGAGIGAFMILTVDPMKALFFLIFLIILQQIEGNFIYPKVVGTSVGLPGIWVLAAVIVGGGLFGIFGMVLGVPLAATIYKVLKNRVSRKLDRPAKQGAAPPENSAGES
ncbi:AI-2E family transporter [Christensenellaceae bacterium 44-20]